MATTNEVRNRAIAERMATRAHRVGSVSAASDSALWHMIVEALEEAEQSAIYKGNGKRAVTMVLATKAARELKMRGTQLSLLDGVGAPGVE